MILDVGCGLSPKGNVNLDVLITTHQKEKYIKFKKVENFIIGDCTNLPLRTGTFNIVYASHVLEHLIRPDLGIKEFKRVSKNKVVIRVPNNPVNIEWVRHYFSWSKTTLSNYLGLFFDYVHVYLYIGQKCEVRGSRIIKITSRLGIFGRFLLRCLLWVCRTELVAVCLKRRE